MHTKISRVLYVSHRYHTNQIPIMKGWQDFGVQVKFLAVYEGIGENHDDVDYYQLKPSYICKHRIDKKVSVLSPNDKERYYMDHFYPSFFDTYGVIKKFKPDLVILRSFRPFNAIISFVCRLQGIPVIMYVQTPLYGFNSHRSFLSSLIGKLFFPSVCFSPVFYVGENRGRKEKANRWYMPKWFVPLIYRKIEERRTHYSRDGIVRILDIGKYRDYKNHYFLVDAISKIPLRKKLRVTIIGQLSNSDEQKYYTKLKKYIENKGLSDIISLHSNIAYQKMEELYSSHDVLVLPSKHETAGMVILEAMANGLCVVASIHCGLASYLEEYSCGYTFSLGTTEELEQILTELVSSTSIIERKGSQCQNVVNNHFVFESYVKCLNEITKSKYRLDLI